MQHAVLSAIADITHSPQPPQSLFEEEGGRPNSPSWHCPGRGRSHAAGRLHGTRKEDCSAARMASLAYATMRECGNVGAARGHSPATFRWPTSSSFRRHVEKFDATSKSSTPRRTVRRHVEKFDAQHRQTRRHTPNSSLTPRHRLALTQGSLAPPLPRCHRLGSKVASAARGGTSNPRRSPARSCPRPGRAGSGSSPRRGT